MTTACPTRSAPASRGSSSDDGVVVAFPPDHREEAGNYRAAEPGSSSSSGFGASAERGNCALRLLHDEVVSWAEICSGMYPIAVC